VAKSAPCDDKERAAVLANAQEEGVSQGNVSHELFQRWPSERPPANLLGMWKDCAKSPGGCLSTTVHKQYRCGAFAAGDSGWDLRAGRLGNRKDG